MAKLRTKRLPLRPVVSIGEYQGRPIAAELRKLADEAERGQVAGLICAYRPPSSGVQCLVMGDFERNPLRGLGAADVLMRRISRFYEAS